MELAAIGVLLAKALAPVAISLVGYAATAAGTWLRAHATSKATSTALDVITQVTQMVVAQLEQTVVPQLRAKLDGGKLTADDAKALATQAVAQIKTILQQKGLSTAIKALGLDDNGLETMVTAKVEQEVYNLKYPNQDALGTFFSSGGTAPVAGSPAAMGR